MVKKIDEFGGWLMFFLVSLWFNFIVIILAGGMLFLTLFSPKIPADFFMSLMLLLRYLICGFIFFRLIKIVKNKEEVTPDKVGKFLGGYLLISILFILFLWLFSNNIETTMIAQLRKSIISFMPPIVYGVIWMAYFVQSKRVSAYYGRNGRF